MRKKEKDPGDRDPEKGARLLLPTPTLSLKGELKKNFLMENIFMTKMVKNF